MARPGVHFEGVLWWSFATFYLVGGLTVASWIFECAFRVTVAGLMATMLAYIGAWHAREIHQDNKLSERTSDGPVFFDPRDAKN